MRPFFRRFICDKCEGMFIEIDDFADAIQAMEPVEVLYEGPAAQPCPCCKRTMRAGQLAIGKLLFDGVVTYCEDHGMWFGDGSLAEVLAQIERSYERGGGSPAQTTSSIYTLLKPRKSTPKSPPVVISAFRHRHLACPVCDGELTLMTDRWACAHCAGTFVENHSLEAMVSEMKGRPWQLATAQGDTGTLTCPVCPNTMQVDWLERVSVDRCGEHGVWFDPLALGSALHQASSIHERRGVASWLRRMF